MKRVTQDVPTKCGPPPSLGQSVTWTGAELVARGGWSCASESSDSCSRPQRVFVLSAEALFGLAHDDDEDCECAQVMGQVAD